MQTLSICENKKSVIRYFNLNKQDWFETCFRNAQHGLIFEIGKGEVVGDLFQKCATWFDSGERKGGYGREEGEIGGELFQGMRNMLLLRDHY